MKALLFLFVLFSFYFVFDAQSHCVALVHLEPDRMGRLPAYSEFYLPLLPHC